MKLRMTRRLKTYENVSDADIARRSPSEHGLHGRGRRRRADLRGRAAVEPERPRVPARARAAIQAEVWFDDTTLRFKPRGHRTATGSRSCRATSSSTCSCAPTSRTSARRCKVERLRRAGARRIDEEAGADAVQAEISGGRTGPTCCAQALGERVSYRVRDVPLTDGEAQRVGARPRCCGGRARSSPSAGTTHGTPDMVVGSQAHARARRRAVRRRRLLRDARPPHLRPRARAPHPLRGGARDGRRGRVRMTPTVRRRRAAPLRRLPGDRHRHRRSRRARPDRGQVPVARRRRRRDVRAWATLCTPYADDDQGFEIMPAVDTQVVVAFEAGDLRRPYVLGACWNGSRVAARVAGRGRTTSGCGRRAPGSLLEFDDTDGAAKVTVSMKSGHKLVLDDAAQEVSSRIRTAARSTIDVGGQVSRARQLDGRGHRRRRSTCTPRPRSSTASINCTTLIATSASCRPSYTPGAGNVW